MVQIKKILKIGIPLLASAVLVWLVFRNQDLGKILQDIKGADYRWIMLSYVVSLISHTARASRWRQLYLPIGYKPPTFRVLLAIMFGYFMNILIPRAGEISRAGLLKRTDDIPFEVSIGTVIAERAFDVLTILFLILTAMLVNYDLFSDIYDAALAQVPEDEAAKSGGIPTIWIVFGVLITAILGTVIWVRLQGLRFLVKLRAVFRNVWKGVKSIRYVHNKALFGLNTLIIWSMYFFMTYFVFFSIPPTSELGLSAGMAVLVMSGIAMLVPVQGGIGAFHLFIATTLIFYGVSNEDGLVYATLMHASQLVLYFIAGGLSFFLAVFMSRKKVAAPA